MSINRPAAYLLLFLILVFRTGATAAEDTVYIRDGSVLSGKLVAIKDATVHLETRFAGALAVSQDMVTGYTTGEKRKIVLDSGDVLSGVLTYDPETGQSIKGTLFGDINLQPSIKVAGLDHPAASDAGGTGAEETEQLEKYRIINEQNQEQIAELEKQNRELQDPWSGKIAFGMNGADGNTDRLRIRGRGEMLRKTDFDRIKLYVEGDLQRENGKTTANEVLAGAGIERDLTERWFAFGKADFEKDDFENLDLRGVTTAGIGYFLFREPAFEWKAMLGAGYQHETFSDGTTSDEGVISLGYEMNYTYDNWLQFAHDLTYFPSLTAPASDYRLVSNTSGELPLGESEAWKLQLGMRNNYDALPRPGVKKLDTTYHMNLVYDWD